MHSIRHLMQTKLTLRLDDKLIRRAKAHAKRSGKSLSQLVAEYFTLLGPLKPDDTPPRTPLVRTLRGVLRGARIDVDDYHKHLEDEHL